MYDVVRTTIIPSLPEWHAGETDGQMKRCKKLALFDWDFTLVKRKSSAIFPESNEDWQWWHPDVPHRLMQLIASDTAIIIVTNQKNLLSGPKRRLDIFESHIQAVANDLQMPFHMYCSVREDLFRKPRRGIWERIMQDYPFTTCNTAYFVGDSAGRKTDWSSSDRKFALKIGLKFFTPEEYCLGQDPAPFRISPYDPKLEAWGGKGLYQDHELARALRELPRVVVMVRPPNHEEAAPFRQYYAETSREVISPDHTKVLPDMSTGLWLIDTTEPSASVRSTFLRSLQVPKTDVGCLWLDRDLQLLWHFRARCLYRDWHSRAQVAEPVDTDILKAELSTWIRRLDNPHVSEGFSIIFKPSFKFFGTTDDYESWREYWD